MCVFFFYIWYTWKVRLFLGTQWGKRFLERLSGKGELVFARSQNFAGWLRLAGAILRSIRSAEGVGAIRRRIGSAQLAQNGLKMVDDIQNGILRIDSKDSFILKNCPSMPNFEISSRYFQWCRGICRWGRMDVGLRPRTRPTSTTSGG